MCIPVCCRAPCTTRRVLPPHRPTSSAALLRAARRLASRGRTCNAPAADRRQFTCRRRDVLLWRPRRRAMTIPWRTAKMARHVRVSAPPSRARWRPPLCAVPRRLRVVLARRSAARPRAFRQHAVHRRVRLQRAHGAHRRLAAAQRRLVRLVWRRPVGGARRGVARATVPLFGLRQPRPVTRVPRLCRWRTSAGAVCSGSRAYAVRSRRSARSCQ